MFLGKKIPQVGNHPPTIAALWNVCDYNTSDTKMQHFRHLWSCQLIVGDYEAREARELKARAYSVW